MSIKIKRNEAGNCIEFQGSSNPVYWNACLSGEVDATDHYERCRSTDSFVAHPIPKEISPEERLYVRNLRRNPIAGGHHITCQPSINRDIEIYVNELIESKT